MKKKSPRRRVSSSPCPSCDALRTRLAQTQARLTEAEETLEAIRSGAVDALLISGPQGEQVFSLQGAETTYRFLVEEMNECALLLALDGTVLYANARFGHLAGVPLEQIVGAPWQRFFPAAEQSRLNQLLRAAASAPVRGEFHVQPLSASPHPRVPASPPSPVPVAISLRSLQRENVRGFSLVITDLTTQKAAEAALREANDKLELRVQERTAQLTRSNDSLLVEMGQRKRSEEELRLQREWFRVTLTSIGDAVIACDSQLRVTFMNPVAAHLSGWGVDEARGQPVTKVFNIVNEVTGRPADNIMARVLQEQRVLGLANHTDLVTRDGRHIPVEDSAAPILNSAGEVIGVIVVFHDVTAKRQAHDALRQSEQRLLLAQQAGGVGVFDWDLTTNSIMWTAQLETIFGLPPGTFEGRYDAWTARIHPEDLAPVERLIRDWLASDRETAEWEYRILRQGEQRWITARSQIIRNSLGKPIRVIGTKTDITERKQEEAALRLMQSSIDGAAEMVAWFRPDGSISYVNDATCRTLGYSRGELLKMNALDFSPGFTKKQYEEHWREVRKRKSFTVEPVHRRKDGSTYTAEVLVNHVVYGGQEFIFAYGRDITDRKQAEEQIRQHLEELRAANEDLTAFNHAAVGRELRMIELKREINELCQKAGHPPRYDVSEEAPA